MGQVKTKFIEIGVQLGIPHYKLLEFKKEDDPLSATLNYWLKGNVIKPVVPISWRSIVKALQSKYVGEPGLAEQIHQKYLCPQEDQKGQILLLAEVAVLVSLMFIAGSSPPPASAEPSSVCIEDNMDPDIKMDLEFVLEENLDKVITKYASYVRCIRVSIQEKGVSPEELKSFLLTLSASSKCSKGEKLVLLSDKKSELIKQHSIIEIFNFLTTECASFLNYDIFQKIMTEYNISESQDELKYSEHLRAYTEKHKISEFHEINPLLKPNGSKELTLLFDIKKTCSLAKVNALKKVVAKALNLNPSALHIIDIREGCKVVTSIPASVADAIFTPETVLTQEQEDELKSASVLSLSCNSHTYMEGKKCKEEKTHTQPQGKCKKIHI